ncbi:hypothetical protein KCU73_g176, partial [Aureobasidium melanogenum]
LPCSFAVHAYSGVTRHERIAPGRYWLVICLTVESCHRILLASTTRLSGLGGYFKVNPFLAKSTSMIYRSGAAGFAFPPSKVPTTSTSAHAAESEKSSLHSAGAARKPDFTEELTRLHKWHQHLTNAYAAMSFGDLTHSNLDLRTDRRPDLFLVLGCPRVSTSARCTKAGLFADMMRELLRTAKLVANGYPFYIGCLHLPSSLMAALRVRASSSSSDGKSQNKLLRRKQSDALLSWSFENNSWGWCIGYPGSFAK